LPITDHRSPITNHDHRKDHSMRFRAAILFTTLTFVSTSAQQTAPAPGSAAAPTATPSCPELATALTALIANDARQRDWSNLARYREANRTLPAPAAGESRIVFMGDSITDAWPQPRFGDFFSGKPYVGRGISGQTTAQMLVRFRPDVIDLKPKVVVILAGTNAYHTAPNAIPQTQLRPMERIRAINDWMKSYAAAEGHVYLDYVAAMSDEKGFLRAELSADDLHPNAQGYAIMGPLAEAAIKQALR
jgi:lysophospholipase L1-like esterase